MPARKASSTAEGGMYPRGTPYQPGNHGMTVFIIECDYNRWRQGRGGLSPEQFENQNLA